MTRLDQCFCGGRPDIASTTCDEYIHVFSWRYFRDYILWISCFLPGFCVPAQVFIHVCTPIGLRMIPCEHVEFMQIIGTRERMFEQASAAQFLVRIADVQPKAR